MKTFYFQEERIKFYKKRLDLIQKIILQCIDVGWSKYIESDLQVEFILDKKHIVFTNHVLNSLHERWSCSAVGILSYLSSTEKDHDSQYKFIKTYFKRSKIEGTNMHKVQELELAPEESTLDMDEIMLILEEDVYEIIQL